MNDSRFRFLVSALCITVIAVAAIAWLPWKQWATPSSDAQNRLGQYVYIDMLNKVHVNHRCPKLNYKGMTSQRVPVDQLYTAVPYSDEITFCPYCINDKTYNQLILLNNNP